MEFDDYRWDGKVIYQRSKSVPDWVVDRILTSHEIWFDAQWNMVVSSQGEKVVLKPGDTIGFDGSAIKVVRG